MDGIVESGATGELTDLQKAALVIDALYASDETAPLHWQDKPQLCNELRAQVRRMVKYLGLQEWQKVVPHAVELYAFIYYKKG